MPKNIFVEYYPKLTHIKNTLDYNSKNTKHNTRCIFFTDICHTSNKNGDNKCHAILQ